MDYVADGAEDYCANFGDQWNRFRPIQIDSLSGARESHDRFFSETGWNPADLKDRLILDAGCGAGRFAEVALECGAYLVAVDLSEAAYACHQTLARFAEVSLIYHFAMEVSTGFTLSVYCNIHQTL